ncbi:MAG: division/cell wall cluster transcriptional repressor MraZ [Acidobacteriota bacterium]|jgi:MraZ protein|nr:division/cell wall cluster transcriptional repressor MraZ [Acidobacteriota bacterium]
MIKGSYLAKIDEKSRLRMPAEFRRGLPETVDNTYYVTSDNGKCAQIYPLPVWEKIEQKLQEPPRMQPAKLKYQRITSYYGLLTEMDSQGRILIPQLLREDAQISGEVSVLAINGDHLEVWNKETIGKIVKDNIPTDEDMAELGL